MEVVLITGVGGLLGSRFSKWLIDSKRDVRVVGIDDFSGGYGEEGMKWELLLYSFNYDFLGATTRVIGSMVELFLFLSLLILGFSLFSKIK